MNTTPISFTCGAATFRFTNIRPTAQAGRVEGTLTVKVEDVPVASLDGVKYSPSPLLGTGWAARAHDMICSALAFAGYDEKVGYHTDEGAGDALRAALEYAPSSPEDPNSDEEDHYVVTRTGRGKSNVITREGVLS